MQNLQLLDCLAEAFRCHVLHYQCLEVPADLPRIDNGAHGIDKLVKNTQIKVILSQVYLMAIFLMRSSTYQSSRYPIVLTRLGGPRSRPKPDLKLWKCRTRDLMVSSQAR